MNTKEQEYKYLSLLNEALNIIKFYDKSRYMQIYEKSFKSLNESFDQEPKLNFDIIIEENKYSRLSKIYESIKQSDKSIKKSLNENIYNTKFDMNTFERLIYKTLNNLKKIDGTIGISNNILKIKTDLKLPINVFGFDIYKVLEKYPDTITAYYDRCNKKIIIYDKFGITKVYDIATDTITTYNIPKNTEKNNYDQIIRSIFCNNLLIIYRDVNSMNLKFTENLYHQKLN